jgi:hypothetical protein
MAALAFMFMLAYHSLQAVWCDSLNSSNDGQSKLRKEISKMPVSLGSYRYPYNATLATASMSLPLPVQVMEQYIQQHSVDAIHRNSHGRKYAIIFYQCPLQAGNRLHHFWNGLLWAVLTNRTVLWKYWDEETCMKYGKEFNLEICRAANSAQDCERVLLRAPWIASYDEWKDRLQLEKEEPFQVPHHVTMGTESLGNRNGKFSIPEDYEKDFGVDLDSKYPHEVVIFPVCFFKYKQLRSTSLQTMLLKTTTARERARKLYALDADFLFGMLHRYTFDFSNMIRASVPEYILRDKSQHYTIGLHSRHRYVGLDGCDITRETDCLNKILTQRSNKAVPVHVNIMSDRTCTVERLTAWLHARNCSVLSATHKAITPDYIKEHGPYAGVGYFEDLAVVSTSRSAIIGMTRTSTDLLRELIVFNRIMEIWEAGNDPSIMDQMDGCILEREENPDDLII